MANGTLAASQIEMLSQSGTGIITITPPATNTNRAITLPDAAGAIVVSGTTPSLNGITFPATQVASAGSNTLDDYEEGTWTPTNAGDATGTISSATGEYIKVGRLVYIRCVFAISANFTSNNIGGLPFTASGNTTDSSIGGATVAMNQTASTLFATINNDTSRISFYTSSNVNNSGGLTTANLVIRYTGVYRSAS
jgi:chitodextrinase